MIRFWCLQRGPADINAADQSAVHPICQDIVQTRLCLAAVGALKRVEHATLRGVKKVFRKASSLSFARPRRSLQFSLSTSRAYATNTLLSASPFPSPLVAVLPPSVKTNTYPREGIDASALLRAGMHLTFCPSGTSLVGA